MGHQSDDAAGPVIETSGPWVLPRMDWEVRSLRAQLYRRDPGSQIAVGFGLYHQFRELFGR